MKKNLFTHLLILAGTFSAVVSLNAQSIHVVPNPGATGSFTYDKFGDFDLSGYLGSPIVFNNSLMLEYNTGNSQEDNQLAVYNGGDSIHLIPNPDGGSVEFSSNPFYTNNFIHNNKLYFFYHESNGDDHLGEYSNDGSIKIIPNPAGYYQIFFAIGHNHNLYIEYGAYPNFQMAMYNDTSITVIPNPDTSVVYRPSGFYGENSGNSIFYNNKLYMSYANAVTGANQLAQFDSTNFKWTLLPNPDTSHDGYEGGVIEYNNKLYMRYKNASGACQLMVYDGINPPSLIPNPGNGFGSDKNDIDEDGFSIVFNNKLFIEYNSASGADQLASFDGTSFTIVPNPDNSAYGIDENATPPVYNNNLYFIYLATDNLIHLAQYQVGSNSLKIIPNPDGGEVYLDRIVYDNNLYFMYINAKSVLQLAYFDGNSIKLIPNPPGNYSDTSRGFYGGYNANGYTGYPVIWNNILYMQFGSVPYADAGNLAFLNAGALPVSLLNLQAKYVSPKDILVSWQTASEDNNKGFEVERSNDGINFSTIGFVAGAVNSDVLLNYSFTDNSGITGKVFYRLKQIDEDGNAKYSNIVYVDISQQNTITFSPNPAQSAVTIISSVSVKEINLVNICGQVIKRWNNISPNQKLDISNISRGVYFLKFVNDGFTQVSKLIKE